MSETCRQKLPEAVSGFQKLQQLGGWAAGHRGLVLLLALLLLILAGPARAQPTGRGFSLSAEQLLGFAHHLFSEQEYFRAIGEYKRFLFFYPRSPEAPTAALRIAQCYFRGRRWAEVLEAVDSFLEHYGSSLLKWRARLLRARALQEMNRGASARRELQAIIRARPGQAVLAQAWYLTGLSYAREGRWLAADECLRQIGREASLYQAARQVRHIVQQVSQSRPKSPALAGVLAAVLPGAGHLYCRRPKDGGLAFLFTGAFAGATVEAFDRGHEALGAGLGFVALAFYGGNIFSAINVAHKLNDRQKRRQRQRLAPYEELTVGQNHQAALAIACKFFF